jgi:uncharacterized membrane protein YqaE (UPF0057 family)
MYYHAEPQTTCIVITAPLVCATDLLCLGARKMRRCCGRSANRIRRKGANPSRWPPITSPIGMLKKSMHDRIQKLGKTVSFHPFASSKQYLTQFVNDPQRTNFSNSKNKRNAIKQRAFFSSTIKEISDRFQGTIFLYFLAIWIPFVPVAIRRGCSADLLINILLCILGWIPGVIHAWYIISKTERIPGSM